MTYDKVKPNAKLDKGGIYLTRSPPLTLFTQSRGGGGREVCVRQDGGRQRKQDRESFSGEKFDDIMI